MDRRLKELAEQVGLITNQDIEENNYEYMNDLERFADLVRQDEREACVKIALRYEPIERSPWVRYAADEIRARGNHEPT